VQRSQWRAALILLGAFLIGGALGFSADHLLHVQRSHGCRASDAHAYWDRIAKEWKLTPAQRVVIDSLMDMQHRKISALYAPARPGMDSLAARARDISDSTQAEMRVILTPEQRRKLDAMRVEARRKATERRACREQEAGTIR